MPDTISVSPVFPLDLKGKESREDFNCSPLIHISPTTFISSSSPPSEKWLESSVARVFFLLLLFWGVGGIFSWDGGTSVKWMVKQDKGMRQRDWCLYVQGWSCLCLCVCTRAQVFDRICVCVSWGEDEWRGLQNLGESVIGREMGNWDLGSVK